MEEQHNHLSQETSSRFRSLIYRVILNLREITMKLIWEFHGTETVGKIVNIQELPGEILKVTVVVDSVIDGISIETIEANIPKVFATNPQTNSQLTIGDNVRVFLGIENRICPLEPSIGTK